MTFRSQKSHFVGYQFNTNIQNMAKHYQFNTLLGHSI